MTQNLVIVESPAKSKTIKKYLGKDFTVLASYGHVRDLVPKEGAVDTEHGYAMKYDIIERNEKHVDKIASAVKKADVLYLATDPDREGEAISWHLLELLKERDLLADKTVQRVIFHQITKKAVQEAVANPRILSQPLINAQQARRALDYLVGFNLSPLLWKKIRRGLSAGRVQSPALRMIVERDEDIDAFDPQEYWTLAATVDKDEHLINAKLHTLKGKKLEQFDINNEQRASEVQQYLQQSAQTQLVIAKVTKRQRKRNPAAPFTTSTLQQDAARKLRFTTQRTMRVAQQLYEGVDLGDGPVGLITYMRTDSVTLAQEALDELRELIAKRYGQDKLPEQARAFKTKSKNAQEAHEAIRPTSAFHVPDEIKEALSDDQFRLYELIWKRTVACQMIPAILNTVSINLACPNDRDSFFRASGSTIHEAGFMAVYEVGNPEDKEKEKRLPPLDEGDTLNLHEILTKQHFTEPPPRYSEASLVKALEEHGIGRPSTYASIISTLQTREYVELESRRFYPTDIGRIVNRFLTDHFNRYVDYDFTANLEDQLDEISRGEKEWVPLMDEFWHPFHELVEDKDKNVSRDEVLQAREIGTDPKTGKPISVRMGRYGPYVQIGTRDDEEKPKFASLRPGQKMNDITLDIALELFKLPRELGTTEEGETLKANIGRFGPYIQYGTKKYVSLKDEDPYSVTFERAKELVAEKKEADAKKLIQDFPEEKIQILNGRWGPYITDGKKNARVPKDTDPKTLTLEDCQKMIAEAPERGKRGAKRKATGKTKAADTKKTTTAKKKAPAKKTTTRKTAAKKAPAKKTTTRKAAAKKTPAKKTTTRKTAAKKTPVKKTTTRKTTAKKKPDSE